MNSQSLLHELEAAGVYLDLDTAGLRVAAPKGLVTFDHKQLLAANRLELTAELMRRKVSAVARDAAIPTTVVQRIDDNELCQWSGFADNPAALRVWLQTLAEDDAMRRGIRPRGYDAPAFCRRCGPVWLPHEQVALLDVVNGWPQVIGCPWCFVHLPEGQDIPRPTAPDEHDGTGAASSSGTWGS